MAKKDLKKKVKKAQSSSDEDSDSDSYSSEMIDGTNQEVICSSVADDEQVFHTPMKKRRITFSPPRKANHFEAAMPKWMDEQTALVADANHQRDRFKSPRVMSPRPKRRAHK